MFHLDNISSDDKNTEGGYTIISGDTDPSIQGNIYETETSRIVSATFSASSQIEFSSNEEVKSFFDEKSYATIGYEGTMVKLQVTDDHVFFANTKRINCRSSFWGNKEKTFYKLWFENGGEKFLSKLGKSELTHHFLISNSDLIITSRMDLRDNETIVVYLGSVDLEGNIHQVSDIDPEIYYMHIDRSSVLPSKKDLAGRILIPTVISYDEAISILTNGYENVLAEEGIIPHSLYRGETVIIRRGEKEIIKIVPKCYEMRKKIAGNTPNMKNHLYRLMEFAKDTSTYSENFPILGCLENSQLKIIQDNTKIESSFIINTFLNRSQNYDASKITCRMANILTNCILFCPLGKIDIFIDAWIDYISCKELVIKFIKKHNADIRHGKYDERLSEFHKKALTRIKNLADVSKIYASEKNTKFSYSSRMEYSLKGLVDNEFGPSLYRIEKAIKYLRE